MNTYVFQGKTLGQAAGIGGADNYLAWRLTGKPPLDPPRNPSRRPQLFSKSDVAAPKAPPPSVPAPAAAPAPSSIADIAAAALMKAASGNPEEASRMFDPKVFVAEKQPNDVRRAYIEVQLQWLIMLSHSGEKCPAILSALSRLGDEDTSLPFTLYGFGAFMKTPHFQYYAGVVEANCGDERNARKRWAKIAKQNEALPSPDYVFPLLAKSKAGSNSKAGLNPALGAALTSVRAVSSAEGSPSKPAFTYVEGMLLGALGQTGEAEESLTQASSSAQDPFLKFLAEVALRELKTPGSPR
jgi:hypothetical protein